MHRLPCKLYIGQKVTTTFNKGEKYLIRTVIFIDTYTQSQTGWKVTTECKDSITNHLAVDADWYTPVKDDPVSLEDFM